MNNTYLAKQGYKTVQKEAASDKAIELRVFMSVTAQLKSVDFENKLEFPKLCDAILENLQLWKILFLDLVNPNNTLPQELKTSLIQLALATMMLMCCVFLMRCIPMKSRRPFAAFIMRHRFSYRVTLRPMTFQLIY